ncbi:hypothetical protein HaLaN_13495, partial [Haematococcus lacustris]
MLRFYADTTAVLCVLWRCPLGVPDGAMSPRKRPSTAEQEPLPTESPRKQAQVLAPLQANNARSVGLNGRRQVCTGAHTAQRCSAQLSGGNKETPCKGPPPPCMSSHCLSPRMVSWPVNVACQSADCAWPQVIKVPSDAVLRGCKKTQRKIMAHFQLRAEVYSQSDRIALRATYLSDLPGASSAEPAAESNKGKAHGKAAKAKPAPQPGRWLDRDCNAALNMQRIGESRWRPLDLFWWPEQG